MLRVSVIEVKVDKVFMILGAGRRAAFASTTYGPLGKLFDEYLVAGGSESWRCCFGATCWRWSAAGGVLGIPRIR